MINQLFKIGDFCFRVICEENLTIPENFMKFASGEAEESYTYRIRVDNTFPKPIGEITAKRHDLQVYSQGGLETRYIGIAEIDEVYACYREISDKEAEIILSSNYGKRTVLDAKFTSLFALEKRLLQNDGLVLHCAYIKHEDMAILFSAPSETGKTTQAKLWEKYRKSKTVNGDRALLQKVNGRWTAKGWPVCGSSEVCNNEELQVKAIVMLSQGKTDEIERLNPVKAFSSLYSQVTVNSWNRNMSMKAIELVEDITTDI